MSAPPISPDLYGTTRLGCHSHLRSALEERGTGYVLAVACSHDVTTTADRFRAQALAGKLSKRTWKRMSAGPGAQGHRSYDWAPINLDEPQSGRHRLLIRSTGELAKDHELYSRSAV